MAHDEPHCVQRDARVLALVFLSVLGQEHSIRSGARAVFKPELPQAHEL